LRLTANAGDLITVFIGAFAISPNYWDSSSEPVTQALFFFYNQSICTYFSAIMNTPSGTSHQGGSAQWVIEFPRQKVEAL
jgi:hypothetical protein